MKFASKLLMSILLLACSVSNIYAITQSEKNKEELNDSKTNTWQLFPCDGYGLSNELVTVKFPSKPNFGSGVNFLYSNQDFVDYILYVLNSTLDMDKISVNRNDYADDIEFRMALLEEYLQKKLDDQSYSKIINHNIFLNNGYTTLDMIEIELENNMIVKSHLIVTQYGGYKLTTRCEIGLEDHHDFFVNSLQID
jgi:hypothetical protein